MDDPGCASSQFRHEFFVENQYYGRPGPEREFFPLERDTQPQAGKQGGLPGYLDKHRARAEQSANMKSGWSDLLVDHGYQCMFDGFVDAVVQDKPTPCDELAGYRATYLGALAMKSIELDKPLPVLVDKWDYYVHLR